MKGSQDFFHKDVETAQSRQAQSQHWQFHRVWRVDKGKWSNSTQKAEVFGWGGHHFGSLQESSIWGTESVMCFLLPACQLCLLMALVCNINTQPFANPSFEQTPHSIEGNCADTRGEIHLCTSPWHCGICWLSSATSVWIGNRLT